MGMFDDMREIRRLIEKAEAEASDPDLLLREAGLPQEFIDSEKQRLAEEHALHQVRPVFDETIGTMATELTQEIWNKAWENVPNPTRPEYLLGWWHHHLAQAQKRSHPPK